MAIKLINNLEPGMVSVSKGDAKPLHDASKIRNVHLTLGDSAGLCMSIATQEVRRARQRKERRST